VDYAEQKQSQTLEEGLIMNIVKFAFGLSQRTTKIQVEFPIFFGPKLRSQYRNNYSLFIINYQLFIKTFFPAFIRAIAFCACYGLPQLDHGRFGLRWQRYQLLVQFVGWPRQLFFRLFVLYFERAPRSVERVVPFRRFRRALRPASALLFLFSNGDRLAARPRPERSSPDEKSRKKAPNAAGKLQRIVWQGE